MRAIERPKGTIFKVVTQTSYLLDCAGHDCKAEILVGTSEQGVANLPGAKRKAKRDAKMDNYQISGWQQIGDLWYCRDCVQHGNTPNRQA